MDIGQTLVLTLTIPGMSLLLFLLAKLDKRTPDDPLRAQANRS